MHSFLNKTVIQVPCTFRIEKHFSAFNKQYLSINDQNYFFFV